MRRVVVTGIGIVSCIGNSQDDVAANLKAGKSGITKDEKMAELGFRSQVSGRPADTTDRAKEAIGKRSLRFMADAAEWSALAMHDAIADAGLSEEQVSNERTGIIAGSGGPSAVEIVRAADITRKNNSPNMPKSQAMLPHPMVMIWLLHLAKAQSALCVWRSKMQPRAA